MNFQEDILPFLSSQRGQWLGLACGALVVLLLLYSLVKVVLLFVGNGEEEMIEAREDIPAEIAKPAPDLADLHLFGEYLPPSDDELGKDAPETSLNLTLVGIFAAPNDEKNATAIIYAAGREQRAYAVGADLPGGATVEEILSDRVIIRYKGKRESLLLPYKELPNATFDGLEQRSTPPRFKRIED